jgi:ATP-dependent protease ClpP protease subunit
MSMREWFRIQLKAEGEEQPAVAEIQIVDFIGDWIDDYWGFGVTARSFVEQLSKLPESVKTLRVHINSPGGDVFGAVNIANALRDQRASKGRKVETIVDGIAASAASVILMAGDPVRIADNGLVMIHNPWTVAVGNAAELQKAAEDLEKFRASNIIPTYQWHSPLSAEEIVALMDATTWMSADEAVTMGFADEKVEGLQAAAALDPRSISKLAVPAKYAARVAALLKSEPPPAPEAKVEPPAAPPASKAMAAADVLQVCAAAGLDIVFAQTLLNQDSTEAEVAARITAETSRRAEAAARETEIRALCRVSGQEDLASELIRSAMPVADVRSHLTKLTAKLDVAEIEAGLAPDHGEGRKPVIDVMAWYAERNVRR